MVTTGEPFGAVVYRTGCAPSRIRAATPVDALVTAVTYLREGYHVLLTDATVAALRNQDGTVETAWLSQVKAAPRPAERTAASAPPSPVPDGAGLARLAAQYPPASA